MKRRSFFRMLAGLACVPLLPKVAAQKAPNLDFTIRGLDPGWTCCTPCEPGDVVGVAGAVGPSGPVGPIEEQPIGTLAAFVGNNAPAGWRMCDGTEITASECSNLVELFPDYRVPDLKGFIVKADLSS